MQFKHLDENRENIVPFIQKNLFDMQRSKIHRSQIVMKIPSKCTYTLKL